MTPTPTALVVRKLAGEDGLERVYRYDPITGERYLASPHTGERLPRPLAGVHFANLDGSLGEAPEVLQMPERYADQEPWVELVNPRPVHQAAGPAEAPWRKTHTFVHVDELVLHMIDGDYRYEVVHQPGKYDDETGELCGEDRAGDPTTHVDHFYIAELAERPASPEED